MHIKVCGITSVDQLQTLQEIGVDYAGFIFYERSPRYIGKHQLTAKVMADANPDIKRIGVFVNEVEEKIIEAVDAWGLTMVQLHGEESPAFCEKISNHVKTIKAFRVNEMESLSYKVSPYQDAVEYFLFDAMGEQYGGTGKQFNWELIKEAHIQKPFFLSGGIGLDDASSVLTFRDDTPLCYAVDVNSRFEIEPGIKNMGLVRQFVDSIKQ
jgi:phosphoribosylanthranilate isomerase